MIETYELDVKQLDKKIVDRADAVCRHVREMEGESRKQLQQLKDKSLKVIQDQQKTLGDSIERLKEKVKETEDALNSRDSSTILLYTEVEENIPQTKPVIDVLPSVPVFSPGPLNILKDMFGRLSNKKEESIQSMTIGRKETSSLLANPSVESVINIENGEYIPVIACVGSGQAWVQTDNRKLQLMDRKGNVKRIVNIDFTILDMAVTPKGKILLPDRNNTCIKSMSTNGKIKTLFNTEWIPGGVCCLPSGGVIVAFRHEMKLVQYSHSGKIMKEFDSSLLQYPWYVAHSQVNQQLYVCDKSWLNIRASGRILNLNMDGNLQYTYTGSDATSFTPLGVCVDLAGPVLMTDYDNNRVHILDKGGNFTKYLLTGEQGLLHPVTIDVDSDGYAWIGEWNTGRVKVVKYTE